jgi:hypothetical protein
MQADQGLIKQAELGEEVPLLGAAQAWLQLNRR